MKNRMIRTAACVIAFACLGSAGRAGVVIQQEGGRIGKQQNRKVTLYIDGEKIRMEEMNPNQKKYVVIFDGDKQVVWMLQPDEGTYREMTAAQVEQMGQQMGQAMQRMQQQLAQMPPAQRKMVEEMMKQRMGAMASAPPTITIEKKESGQKVGPYTTTHYQVLANGQISQEIWAAPADQVHLQPSDFKTFQDMAKFYRPLTRNAPKGSWSPAAAMQQIKGLPVRTVIYEEQQPTFEWNVTNVERRSVDSGLFTVPGNYKKIEMPMGPGGGMEGGGGR